MSDFLISEVKIYGLFGYLNHDIPLKQGGITFIHGPNGCGKTTVLRLISAIYSWDASYLLSADFKTIEIVNSDKSTFYVEKDFETIKGTQKKSPALKFGFRERKSETHILSLSAEAFDVRPSEIEEFIPFLTRSGPREWTDRNTGVRVSYQEVIEKYFDKIHVAKKERPPWIEKYIKRLNLHFIKTQRLLKVDAIRRRPDEVSAADVIKIYSNEITEIISKKLAEQAAVSQLHDRSFPKRLLSSNKESMNPISEDWIRIMYEETEKKVQRLIDAGLIDQQENISLPTQDLDEAERRVLALYLEDVNKKLSVFDELQSKTGIFLEIITKKLKTKKFSINRKDGFRIESIHHPGTLLSPSQLSSGEQHQIVLFYELIFKADSNSFFLIDEPEISLHVDWQRKFLGDIERIATLGDRNFLIATHSPQIIGSHRELAVALDEGILGDE